MSRSVELSEFVYAALEEAAAAAGTTPAEWIAANLPPAPAHPERLCRTASEDACGAV